MPIFEASHYDQRTEILHNMHQSLCAELTFIVSCLKRDDRDVRDVLSLSLTDDLDMEGVYEQQTKLRERPATPRCNEMSTCGGKSDPVSRLRSTHYPLERSGSNKVMHECLAIPKSTRA